MSGNGLAEAGIKPVVGSIGDAYDNVLAESVIGLHRHDGATLPGVVLPHDRVSSGILTRFFPARQRMHHARGPSQRSTEAGGLTYKGRYLLLSPAHTDTRAQGQVLSFETVADNPRHLVIDRRFCFRVRNRNDQRERL